MPFLLAAALSAGQLLAQTVTGTITGTVTDPSDQVIAGAKVTLTNDRTGEIRVVSTNDTGMFSIGALEPGPYSIKVEQGGFKTSRRTGIVLSANERLSAGDFQLSIGSLSETVTVEAQAVVVQTASAEHSSVISGSQVDQLQMRGRDPVSLLKILPGVASFSDSEALGSDYGTGTPTIGGVSNNTNHLAIDGVTSNDLGTPSVFSSPISMDAIGEVKTLLTSYQAEYGGNGGAVVQIVTKSGTQQFHGGAYWYKRHEMFNANTFFNNQTGTPKAKYRYITLGGSISGPVYIPGKFNRNKDKLFFFYNVEDWGTKQPQGLRQVTMPTALERTGDFSQTVDLNNKMIVIKDPTNNGTAFTDNKIPANRVIANGQSILNIFPLPNFPNRAISGGNYNYTFQESLDVPKLSHLFRIDLPVSAVNKFSLRGSHWYSDQGGYACSSCASNWGLFKQHYRFAEEGLTFNWVHIFSPTIVNEFNVGVRNNKEKWYPDTDKDLQGFQRANRGLSTLGQWYPQDNDLGIIPQASFGGVTGGASISYDGRGMSTIHLIPTLPIRTRCWGISAAIPNPPRGFTPPRMPGWASGSRKTVGRRAGG
ncbi:MAG: carboxypeptidase regulatory-like domain-containing protein [Acidobacteriia bacterium]|nr:carboxypeptidase regulatory-like domain-containing protein [Terriglobia bacterium]